MNDQTPTALASQTLGILRWGENEGLDRGTLLRAANLDEDALLDPTARIPCSSHIAIWRETERQLGTSNFGLESAESILDPSSFGVVGFLAMTSATAGEGIDRAVRYARVLKEDLRSHASTDARALTVHMNLPDDAPRPLVDCSVAAYAHFMRRWTGERVAVREVFFRHERPVDTGAYEARFDCRVHFGHASNTIVFDRDAAGLRLVTAQADVASYLETLASSAAARLSPHGEAQGLAAQVSVAVCAGLESGDTRIAAIARRLGMGPRTLQRALSREGLEFRRIVDDARWAIAAPLVATSDLPLEVIAEQLGYAEAKAFRRAFRRWSGLSPAEMRRAHRATRTPPTRPPPSGTTLP